MTPLRGGDDGGCVGHRAGCRLCRVSAVRYGRLGVPGVLCDMTMSCPVFLWIPAPFPDWPAVLVAAAPETGWTGLLAPA